MKFRYNKYIETSLISHLRLLSQLDESERIAFWLKLTNKVNVLRAGYFNNFIVLGVVMLIRGVVINFRWVWFVS